MAEDEGVSHLHYLTAHSSSPLFCTCSAILLLLIVVRNEVNLIKKYTAVVIQNRDQENEVNSMIITVLI